MQSLEPPFQLLFLKYPVRCPNTCKRQRACAHTHPHVHVHAANTHVCDVSRNRHDEKNTAKAVPPKYTLCLTRLTSEGVKNRFSLSLVSRDNLVPAVPSLWLQAREHTYFFLSRKRIPLLLDPWISWSFVPWIEIWCKPFLDTRRTRLVARTKVQRPERKQEVSLLCTR